MSSSSWFTGGRLIMFNLPMSSRNCSSRTISSINWNNCWHVSHLTLCMKWLKRFAWSRSMASPPISQISVKTKWGFHPPHPKSETMGNIKILKVITSFHEHITDMPNMYRYHATWTTDMTRQESFKLFKNVAGKVQTRDARLRKKCFNRPGLYRPCLVV